jgi:hypothetical protein
LFLTHIRLVESTLKGVDPSRRCFRNVGGVLVERTVKEVLPAISSNKEQVLYYVAYVSICQIGQLIARLEEQRKQMAKDAGEFQRKYNIRIKGEVRAALRSALHAPVSFAQCACWMDYFLVQMEAFRVLTSQMPPQLEGPAAAAGQGVLVS